MGQHDPRLPGLELHPREQGRAGVGRAVELEPLLVYEEGGRAQSSQRALLDPTLDEARGVLVGRAPVRGLGQLDVHGAVGLRARYIACSAGPITS
ncbi:MAG: hypothetical protein WKH64_03745 [Chloroflexia bacterium]